MKLKRAMVLGEKVNQSGKIIENNFNMKYRQKRKEKFLSAFCL
jgi:hypothetical protein